MIIPAIKHAPEIKRNIKPQEKEVDGIKYSLYALDSTHVMGEINSDEGKIPFFVSDGNMWISLKHPIPKNIEKLIKNVENFGKEMDFKAVSYPLPHVFIPYCSHGNSRRDNKNNIPLEDELKSNGYHIYNFGPITTGVKDIKND